MNPPELVLCELQPDAFGIESLSPYCVKVHRALKFHGLSYERRYARRPSEHKEHPLGQVPVLLVDGEPVPDSTQILAVLEGLGSKNLVPEDQEQQASAWLWEDYADRVIGYYVFAARWYDDRNWSVLAAEQFKSVPGFLQPWLPNYVRKRILKSMSSMEFIRVGQDGCWEMFTDHLDKLEARAPADNFWVGPQPTVADISLFGMLHCLRSDLSAWQREQINSRPALFAWLERVNVVSGG